MPSSSPSHSNTHYEQTLYRIISPVILVFYTANGHNLTFFRRIALSPRQVYPCLFIAGRWGDER